MSALKSRQYNSPNDLPAMVALTQALRSRGQTVYPIAADLHEELTESAVQVTTRLWENQSGELAGFTYVNRYQNMVDVFDSEVLTPALEAEMVAWLVTAVHQRAQTQGETLTLHASALESDLPRLEFLQRHGFERLEESSLLYACSLQPPIPEPTLLPGYTIRPMGGEAEIEAYVALHRWAFGTDNMTVEYRRAIMTAPSYLPELDLVAVAPNGDLAAFCVCQIFPDDAPRAGGRKEGWTDPVGTHPDHQRLGLAKALILAGMRRLQARGVDTALLGTSSQNLPMQRLAESLGFWVASHTLWFSKQV